MRLDDSWCSGEVDMRRDLERPSVGEEIWIILIYLFLLTSIIKT